jgi:hypothetical protein
MEEEDFKVEEDKQLEAVSTLYVVYRFFHKQVMTDE